METILWSSSKTVVISPDHPFVMIGERINPSGRKKLGAEMAAGDFLRVRRDAAWQAAAGAQILDVNAGYPLGDESAMLVTSILQWSRHWKLPWPPIREKPSSTR